MKDGIQEAITLLEKAAAAKPEDFTVRSKLTCALAKSGRFSEAVTSLLHAVAIQPEWTQFHYELLETLTRSGCGTMVNNAIRDLAKREAGDATIWYILGLSYQTLSMPDEAVASYQKGLEKDPTNAVLHTNLGTAFKSKGDEKACIRSQLQAIAHSPTLAEPHYILGVLYMKALKRVEARKHFERFLQLGQPYLRGYLDDARFSLSILTGRLPDI